jgi:predicted nucleic acid-binding protein
VVDRIFEKAAADRRELITSELTLCETLVIPYRAGDMATAERYEVFLGASDRLTLVPIDRKNLRAAAELRAHYRLKTPDAIQIAAALSAQCSAFITNDRKLPEIAGLRILNLSDLR